MKWHHITNDTYAMVVPGGVVIRYDARSDNSAMTFVPCNNPDRWIQRNTHDS